MPYVCVEDRKGNKTRKGVLMDHCKWKELEDIVNRNERIAQQAAEKIKYMQERKDLSAKMQSEWDNTYVNMRKKRFEEMEIRRIQAEEERERKYWQLRAEEQEMRDKATAKARYMMGQQKDYTKNINRALVLSEVLRERKAQVDFNNKLKQQEIEREIEYAKSIKEDVEKFQQEEFERFNSKGPYREKLKEIAINTLKEYQENKLKEALSLKEEGREELKRLGREIKEQEEKDRLERKEQRERAIRNIEENIQMKQEYKRRQQRQDEEDDEKIRIISEAKKRLNNERKRREKKSQEAAVSRRNKVAMTVAAQSANFEKKENARIAKAQEEREAASILRDKTDLENIEKLRQERIKAYKIYRAEEEQKKHDEYEINKWIMLQRFKKEEANREFEENTSDKMANTTLENRKYWNKQIKERRDKEQREVEEDVDAMNRALNVWKNEDEANLKYAEELLEECKKIGRPTYPLDKVLQEYKKVIGALPIRPLSATWRSNIPIFNPAVEEEAERRMIDRPKFKPKCACVPRNGNLP